MLAGDIGSYQDRSRLMETDFGLGRSSRPGWPAPVVYVPGNHEYDNLDFDETHDRLRELCHALDIHWLERETRVMQGVRLVGTTLWTDFDALAQPDEELGSVLKKRAKAFRAADLLWLPACAGMANPSWRNRCANRASPASNGWTKRCASPSTASPSSSRTSPPRWPAPIRATASRPAPPASAMRWTRCCRAPTTGCTATCIARWTI